MTKKILIPVLVLSLVACSCGKYDDGPDLSFRSKKARLFGYWIMDKWTENGVEHSSQQFQHKFGFARDGTYYYSVYDSGFNLWIEFDGTWEFRSNKEQLVLALDDPRNGVEYQVWDITRLASKELWIETYSPGMLLQWQLLSQ